MNTKLSKLALAIGAVTMVGTAMAATTDTADLAVSASVANVCAIGQGTLDFGALALVVTAGAGTVGTNGNNDANSGSTISIVCTNGASATIGGGLGLHAADTVRNMKSGDDLLAYELYTNTGRGTVLDEASGTIPYTGTGAATTTTAIYGRITAAQLAAAKKGTYADTVALVITYTP